MKSTFAILLVALLLTACGENSYTLYRSSPVPTDDLSLRRVHVATFDAYENQSYNQENCQTAASLFQAQPGVRVKYWCEKGEFKK
jgi:ABC-type glycerol-3-phosphate transport system substrate-binding protein